MWVCFINFSNYNNNNNNNTWRTHTGCSMRCLRSVTRWEFWGNALNPLNWHSHAWWRPRPPWNTTSQSRRTPFALILPCAWGCAKAFPWIPKSVPFSRCPYARYKLLVPCTQAWWAFHWACAFPILSSSNADSVLVLCPLYSIWEIEHCFCSKH